jgi:hypothetical protein
LNEWDPTGGIDASAAGFTSSGTRPPKEPMIGTIACMGVYKGLSIETTLDPKTQPFLYDHQINGTPVLPGVMGIEAFAEAALLLLPGWHIRAVEDVKFDAPFKFYRHDARTITVEAKVHPKGKEIIAECRLIGSRTLPNHSEPQITTHFTGRVRLANSASTMTATAPTIPGPVAPGIEAADIYRLYFHGPAYQVLERAWWDGERMVGLLAKHLPNNHVPAESTVTVMPRLIELCFQTAGLWEIGARNRMGLPHQLDCLSTLNVPEPVDGRLYAVVTPDAVTGSFDADVVDASGQRFVHLGGYRTVAAAGLNNPELVKALQAMLFLEPVAA